MNASTLCSLHCSVVIFAPSCTPGYLLPLALWRLVFSTEVASSEKQRPGHPWLTSPDDVSQVLGTEVSSNVTTGLSGTWS